MKKHMKTCAAALLLGSSDLFLKLKRTWAAVVARVIAGPFATVGVVAVVGVSGGEEARKHGDERGF
jgi:hypothetical protein